MKSLLITILSVCLINAVHAQTYNPVFGNQDFKGELKLSKLSNSVGEDSVLTVDRVTKKLKFVLKGGGSGGGYDSIRINTDSSQYYYWRNGAVVDSVSTLLETTLLGYLTKLDSSGGLQRVGVDSLKLDSLLNARAGAGTDSFAYRRDLTSITDSGYLSLGSLNGKDTFPIILQGNGSGGGAGSIEYITQGYGIKVDSVGRVYAVKVDSTVIASKAYADALAVLKLNSSDTSNFVNKTSNQIITGQKKFLDTLVLVSKPIRLESVDATPVSLFDARVTGVVYPWLSINGDAYGSKIIMGANNSASAANIFSILASYDVTLQSGTYRDLIVDAAEQLKLRGRRSSVTDTAISFVTGSSLYNYVGYFNTAGKLTLPKYSAGAITGTPAYMAAFASNGDLISTALPVGGTTINFVDNEEPAAGTGTSITMANTPTAGSLRVYKNGVKLRLSQFSFTGTTLTLTTSRLITDEFSFQYRY